MIFISFIYSQNFLNRISFKDVKEINLLKFINIKNIKFYSKGISYNLSYI